MPSQMVVSPSGALLYMQPLEQRLELDRPTRGKVLGWSDKAARRHVQWLQSVEVDSLDGWGVAVTLTVRDLPGSAAELRRAFEAWLQRQRERGMIRYHWVIEDQRRGVPHFHVGLWLPELELEGELEGRRRWLLSCILRDWCQVAAQWGPRMAAQHAAAIKGGGVGWAKYCAKHSARSAAHVQRAGLPEGWESSGRLWGYGGDWITTRDSWTLDPVAYGIVRRLFRAWAYGNAHRAVQQARRAAEGAKTDRGKRTAAHHLVTAQRRLQWLRGRDVGLKAAPFKGMREWLPRATAERFLELAVQLGGRADYGWDLDGPELELELEEPGPVYVDERELRHAAARQLLGLVA